MARVHLEHFSLPLSSRTTRRGPSIKPIKAAKLYLARAAEIGRLIAEHPCVVQIHDSQEHRRTESGAPDREPEQTPSSGFFA